MIREYDIFARVGGEEFVILLRDTPLEASLKIAEKIRKKIESSTIFFEDNPITISVSIGISQLDKVDESIEDMYKRADQNLYRAKEEGRNRVVS